MRVSGSSILPPPAVDHARSSGRPAAAAPAETAPPPAPATTPEPVESDAPAESGKAHGLVRAAEHSHRSDVAALRQWINHPDLRSDLPLPDLSLEHKGKGFEKAVAAYEEIIAMNAPPATEPPLTTEPSTTEPQPTPDPAPIGDPALPEPSGELDLDVLGAVEPAGHTEQLAAGGL